MADSTQLEVVKRGATAWNEWRQNLGKRPGPRKIVHVSHGSGHRGSTWASGNGLDLTKADLVGYDLAGANLAGVDLMGANLQGSDLSGANMTDSNLLGVRFTAGRLAGADLSHALLGYTEFVRVDLSDVNGLDSARHTSPSTIDVETIYRSGGRISQVFLRGAGVPETFITYMQSLASKPIEFYSCFISHSSLDREFAEKLKGDVDAQGIERWYFPDDAKIGELMWGEIDRAILIYDKVVLVCSANSLQSQPVIREIERALQREDREHRSVLFPICIDNYLFEKWDHPLKPDVVRRVVGDFRQWINHDDYRKKFNQLLDALNKPRKS